MPWKYDPKKVIVTAFAIPLTGYAPGTFVTAEFSENMFDLAIGPDGKATRGQTNNESGIITVTLQAKSPSNPLLSAAHAVDRATGDGMGPVLIKDLWTSTAIITCELAWVQKMPNVGYGDAAAPEPIVWTFQTDKLIMNM